MERNWLIRTSQNQILGPVAKAKVLEFLQKGALGLNDEVASGNGYWFSLKEKDLVDKYLYGDLPQGYNPISESKSVLSRRDNPDRTTSINSAPANKTQVIKLGSLGPGVLPANDDLEYPDVTLVSTNIQSELKQTQTSGAAVAAAAGEVIKVPAADDLEFPDVTLIAASIKSNPHVPVAESQPVATKSQHKAAAQAPGSVSSEPVVYPEGDDLDYPDLDAPAAAPAPAPAPVKEVVEEERDFTVTIVAKEPGEMAPQEAAAPPAEVAVEKKRSAKDFNNDFESGSGLSLDSSSHHEAHKSEPVQPKKVEKAKESHPEEKKLLHERKVKASTKSTHGAETKEVPKEAPVRVMPEHLKKRNDNYLWYVLIILVLIILSLFFYYYRTILNKPLPV
ncbi:MAG: hypothetical protein WC635_04055 [Bacteriovorax sp.]|jgi:hypothetical protein